MNLNRLLILIAGLIAFSRDYFFTSELIYDLILSLFMLESFTAYIIRPITLRANNDLKNENIYFLFNSGLKMMVFIFFFICFITILLCSIFIYFKLGYIYILAATCLPFNFIYKYLYSYFNIDKTLIYFQLLEVFKHIINLFAFYFAEPMLILANYFFISLIVFLYWLKSSNKLNNNKINNFQKILNNFSSDIFYFLNSIILFLPIILDKFLYINGEMNLEYLLITKFIFFILSFLNLGFILPSQVIYKEKNEYFDSYIWIKENYLIIIFIILFKYFFFSQFINYLPISLKINFNHSLILVSIFMLLTLVLFNTVHREAISKELTNRTGIIIFFSSLTNIIIILFINFFGPVKIMLLQTLLFLPLTAYIKFNLINKQ